MGAMIADVVAQPLLSHVTMPLGMAYPIGGKAEDVPTVVEGP